MGRSGRIFNLVLLGIVVASMVAGCGTREEKTEGDIHWVSNEGGPVLGYSAASGVRLIEVEGLLFKDLNKNQELDPYEDWRLGPQERAKDLASKMSVEQIAGLMLYSSHQSIPSRGRGGRSSDTYGGKPYAESGAEPWEISDNQEKFLIEDNVRHVLVTSVESPEVAALWNNSVQALVESEGLGIPANNSSDPRHRIQASAEYDAGSGGDISMWPGSLGMAASFDPSLVRQFGDIASREYRALGIATALSPQIDLATEPRWSRVSGTFGEDPQLATDMARAYVDGFQTSASEFEITNGWGYQSVNAMIKHWPGGGTGEAGRDAHYGYGKYSVYPGNQFQTQLTPFIEGAFKLDGPTGMATAVMPYYTISFNQDQKYGENVGNSYSKYIINDLLRGKYSFNGVVCTDWGITRDEGTGSSFAGGKPWGVEDGYTVAERHYKILMAGVDQFGGNNDLVPVVEAYNIGKEELGESAIRERFEQSAIRLLMNIFRVGLFENPYLEVNKSVAAVGNSEFMKAGFEAQLKSIVMLKNKGQALPLKSGLKVYIPKRVVPARRDRRTGVEQPESLEYPVNMELAGKYFPTTDDPEEADVALVFVQNPASGRGYSAEDKEAGGNGYLPISLQYEAYTADAARNPSIAGDPREKDVLNRTYQGKKVATSNASDLENIRKTVKAMNGKPVIVSASITNPMLFSEFEKQLDGILVNFGVQDQAVFEVLSGKIEPSGLLPLQMPANMKTVEEQGEDAPHDMKCHVDSEGNSYDFAYGLSWEGIIQDERTSKYKK